MSKMKDHWAEINGIYEQPRIIEFDYNQNKKDKEKKSGNKRFNKKI